MKNFNTLTQDPAVYLESVAKQDKDVVREALVDNGAGTILRMCIGVTGKMMPYRTLGYVASAVAIQERYFPESELQIVYPVIAANRCNDVDSASSRYHVGVFDSVIRSIYPMQYAGYPSREGKNVKSLFDGESPDEALQLAVAEVLDAKPEIVKRFRVFSEAKSEKLAEYVTAHVLLHDTNPQFRRVQQTESVTGYKTNPVSQAARVVSIGAQSERPFYLARMACQEAKILPEARQISTGQLFTRHVIAPYHFCRGGEPSIAHRFRYSYSTRHDPNESSPLSIATPASVVRDIIYTDHAVQDARQKYQDMTEDVQIGSGLNSLRVMVLK